MSVGNNNKPGEVMMKRLVRCLMALSMLALSLFAATRADAAAELSPCSGGTTTLPSGTQVNPYDNKTPAEDQSFDGPNTTFTPNAYDNDHGMEIGENVLRNRLCVGRANVKNIIDPSYQQSWKTWHDDIGGEGVQVFSKNINIGDMYLHGGEDGIKLQNCAEGNPPAGSNDCKAQQPGGVFHISDVAIRNQHDDAIDDDDCMPGTIDNVLIEGHTGLSVQEEGSSTGACQSAGEGNISISNSVIRTMPVSKFTPADGDQFAGGGKWFKFQDNNGIEDHHTLNLSNVVLVVDRKPRSGWPSLDLPGANGTPGDTTWSGTNFILYLNTAGEPYDGPTPGTQGIPSSVTFMTGTAARNKFTDARDDWLQAHGCDRQGSGDLNPKDDPMCRLASPK